jgi:hypothetical protein
MFDLAAAQSSASAAGAGPQAAAAGATSGAPRVVYLTGDESLTELRHRNPQHYARARRIIAAADSLCRSKPPHTEYAKFDARDIACVRSMIFTSYPPQRRLSFRLDDTEYVAMVVLREHLAKLVPAH